MNGFNKAKKNMNNIFIPETCIHRIIFMGMMNEIPISKGTKGGHALFLQDAERNAAYFRQLKPGYLCTLVQVHKKLGCLKRTQTIHKDCGINWQTGYESVSRSKTSNFERVQKLPKRRVEERL